MSELKPCPFCGSATPAIGYQQGQGETKHYFVNCPECLASTNCLVHSGYDEAEAIAAWNRRAAPDALVEALLAQWRKEITGAPKNTDYLRGYWDGRATAHNDLDSALRPVERGGGMICSACEEGRHWDCCMASWCECDCPGPEGDYFDFGELEDMAFDSTEDAAREGGTDE